MIRQKNLTKDTALENLQKVVDELTADFDKWNVEYGELFRHQRPDSNGKFSGDEGKSFPIAGGHPHVGMVFHFLIP